MNNPKDFESEITARARQIVANATYQVKQSGEELTWQELDKIHDEAAAKLAQLLQDAQRAGYEQGRIDEAKTCEKARRHDLKKHPKDGKQDEGEEPMCAHGYGKISENCPYCKDKQDGGEG